MKKVTVIAAHPDDEILGAGGALLRHRDSGDALQWIIVTGIHTAQGFSPDRVASRQQEIKAVAERLGTADLVELDFPTMSLHGGLLGEIIAGISRAFQAFRPQIVYTLNRSDAHSDHRVISDAVMACTKSFRYPFIEQVLMYECLSETEFAPALPEKAFLPNHFVDISAALEEKLELMEIYASELGEHPFPRSLENIRALAHFRGAMIGAQYAEAFQLVKSIVR